MNGGCAAAAGLDDLGPDGRRHSERRQIPDRLAVRCTARPARPFRRSRASSVRFEYECTVRLMAPALQRTRVSDQPGCRPEGHGAPAAIFAPGGSVPNAFHRCASRRPRGSRQRSAGGAPLRRVARTHGRHHLTRWRDHLTSRQTSQEVERGGLDYSVTTPTRHRNPHQVSRSRGFPVHSSWAGSASSAGAAVLAMRIGTFAFSAPRRRWSCRWRQVAAGIGRDLASASRRHGPKVS